MRMTSQTDPAGYTTDYAYDRLDRQTTVTLSDPDGAGGLSRPVYTTTYDVINRVLRQYDPLGNYRQNDYDLLGNEPFRAEGEFPFSFEGVRP